MLLSMIAFVFDPLVGGTIDTDRTTIYERYVAKLISRRHNHTTSQKSEDFTADLEKVKGLLGAVAYRGIEAHRNVFPLSQMTAAEQMAFSEFEGILTWAGSTDSYTFLARNDAKLFCGIASCPTDARTERRCSEEPLAGDSQAGNHARRSASVGSQQ